MRVQSLHGITLELILTRLVGYCGWAGRCIDLNCFIYDPIIKSGLTFLRRTP